MQCPVCHNEVAPQTAFCNHCGASLAAPAPPAAASTSSTGFTEVPPASSAGYTEIPPAYTAPPPGYTPPPSGYPPPGYPPPGPGASGLSPNAAAAIAYITFIPAVIFLVIEPYNKIPLVRFHSFQSIGLTVVAVILQMLVTVMQVAMAVTGLGLISILFGLVHMVIALGLFIVWIMAILKASKGEWFKIPIVGDFCLKQAQS